MQERPFCLVVGQVVGLQPGGACLLVVAHFGEQFAAGQTTAILGWIGSAVLARALGVPASSVILAIMIAWAAATALIATATPKGDYAKARKALKAR